MPAFSSGGAMAALFALKGRRSIAGWREPPANACANQFFFSSFLHEAGFAGLGFCWRRLAAGCCGR
jgi:hypothetical protein